MQAPATTRPEEKFGQSLGVLLPHFGVTLHQARGKNGDRPAFAFQGDLEIIPYPGHAMQRPEARIELRHAGRGVSRLGHEG